MRECPFCHSQVSDDHLFCQRCGVSLKLPEYDPAFCPHCGARVSGRQEFCHECHWPLEPVAEGLPRPRRPGRLTVWQEKWQKHPARAAVLAGGVAVALLAVLFYSLWPTAGPGPPAPPELPAVAVKATPAPEAVAAPTPPAPEAVRRELDAVLANLRRAQLRGDIEQYMQAYSPAFPEMERKRQRTLQVWRAYDYLNLSYRINAVQPLSEDKALAVVTWNLSTRKKANRQTQSQRQTFRVWFAREPGGWRITKVELVAQS